MDEKMDDTKTSDSHGALHDDGHVAEEVSSMTENPLATLTENKKTIAALREVNAGQEAEIEVLASSLKKANDRYASLSAAVDSGLLQLKCQIAGSMLHAEDPENALDMANKIVNLALIRDASAGGPQNA